MYGCIKSISLSNKYNLMHINLFGYENIIKVSQNDVWKFLWESDIFILVYWNMKVGINFNDHKHIYRGFWKCLWSKETFQKILI
jgi:hypothetical protein